MNRVTFLIDGFNLYHSIIQLKFDTGRSVKWLNLFSLCTSYVHLFGGTDKEANLESVYYFTALPEHYRRKNPEKIERHNTYIKCLESTGVKVERGRFKRKTIRYKQGIHEKKLSTFEEKETDVAIAVKLLEIFFIDKCDTAVVVSGDTDLVPALKTCKRLFSNKKVICAFPYRRLNLELDKLAPDSFNISQQQYINYQFPNPVVLEDGSKIFKPSLW